MGRGGGSGDGGELGGVGSGSVGEVKAPSISGHVGGAAGGGEGGDGGGVGLINTGEVVGRGGGLEVNCVAVGIVRRDDEIRGLGGERTG